MRSILSRLVFAATLLLTCTTAAYADGDQPSVTVETIEQPPPQPARAGSQTSHLDRTQVQTTYLTQGVVNSSSAWPPVSSIVAGVTTVLAASSAAKPNTRRPPAPQEKGISRRAADLGSPISAQGNELFAPTPRPLPTPMLLVKPQAPALPPGWDVYKGTSNGSTFVTSYTANAGQLPGAEAWFTIGGPVFSQTLSEQGFDAETHPRLVSQGRAEFGVQAGLPEINVHGEVNADFGPYGQTAIGWRPLDQVWLTIKATAEGVIDVGRNMLLRRQGPTYEISQVGEQTTKKLASYGTLKLSKGTNPQVGLEVTAAPVETETDWRVQVTIEHKW